jgi:tRNA dimethylallyltransferase
MIDKPKILVVLGPTSTGKSDLAVKLAKLFKGEIISADSRQVYKGMDLGTGKITKKEMAGISHYMLDVVSPKSIYNVSKYKIKAQKIITNILNRNKLPIICGGTGFYIDAVVNNIVLPDVLPNPELRKELEKKTAEQLYIILKKLDSARARKIDRFNKVRLVRAIEIAKSLGKVPKVKNSQIYNPFFIGLDMPDLKLKERISTRLNERLKAGMVAEVRRLYEQGVSYRRLEKFGLEYRNCALFLQKKITMEQLVQNLEREIFQYAKRQRTWFRRNPPSFEKAMTRQSKKTIWLDPTLNKNIILILKEINKFLNK